MKIRKSRVRLDRAAQDRVLYLVAARRSARGEYVPTGEKKGEKRVPTPKEDDGERDRDDEGKGKLTKKEKKARAKDSERRARRLLRLLHMEAERWAMDVAKKRTVEAVAVVEDSASGLIKPSGGGASSSSADILYGGGGPRSREPDVSAEPKRLEKNTLFATLNVKPTVRLKLVNGEKSSASSKSIVYQRADGATALLELARAKLSAKGLKLGRALLPGGASALLTDDELLTVPDDTSIEFFKSDSKEQANDKSKSGKPIKRADADEADADQKSSCGTSGKKLPKEKETSSTSSSKKDGAIGTAPRSDTTKAADDDDNSSSDEEDAALFTELEFLIKRDRQLRGKEFSLAQNGEQGEAAGVVSEVVGQDDPDENDAYSYRSESSTTTAASERLGRALFKRQRQLDAWRRGSSSLVIPEEDQDPSSQELQGYSTPLQPARVEVLPAHAKRKEILDAVRGNQVSLVVGATGSGKTTQTPQFILEDACSTVSVTQQDEALHHVHQEACYRKAGETFIVCCQPRRIAAIGVAERVASERGEHCGEYVGYAVRGDVKWNRKKTRILFCTTGVLLNMFLHEQGQGTSSNADSSTQGEAGGGPPAGLSRVTHLLLDEVHERSLHIDFLLTLLKNRVLTQYPRLKVVLMSATVDSQLFVNYFKSSISGYRTGTTSASRTSSKIKDNIFVPSRNSSSSRSREDAQGEQEKNVDVPVVSIEGRTFPVQTLWPDQVKVALREADLDLIEGEDSKILIVEGEDKNTKTRSGDRKLARHLLEDSSTTLKSRLSSTAPEFAPANRSPSTLTTTTTAGTSSSSSSASSARKKSTSAVMSPVMETDWSKGNGVEQIGKIVNCIVMSYLRNSAGKKKKSGTSKEATVLGSSHENKHPGILIFLPGAKEIDCVIEYLSEQSRFGHLGLDVFPLHGQLPSTAQRRIFEKQKWRSGGVGDITDHMQLHAPKIRVIVATNIAETSITVPDITDVIDSGLLNESRYCFERKMRSLTTVFVSHAMAKQRQGRAGRVCAGRCWRLYDRSFYEEQLPSHSTPEMQRTALEELVLFLALQLPSSSSSSGNSGSMKNRKGAASLSESFELLKIADIPDFLRCAPQPPDLAAIYAAQQQLIELGALIVHRSQEQVLSTTAATSTSGKASTPKNASTNASSVSYIFLTPLGFALGRLPLEPQLGKLLLTGHVLGATESCLTIGAALSLGKSPFLKPTLAGGEQQGNAIKAARAEHFGEAATGEHSDHLALCACYDAWAALGETGEYWEQGGTSYYQPYKYNPAQRQFCSEYLLANSTMEQIQSLREQLRNHLKKCFRGLSSSPCVADNHKFKNTMTLCALTAAFFPQVAQIQRDTWKKGKGKGKQAKVNIVPLDLTGDMVPFNQQPNMSAGSKGKSCDSTKDTGKGKGKDSINLYAGSCWVHPSSFNYKILKEMQANHSWLLYYKMMHTSALYLFDTTAVNSLVLLLFAPESAFRLATGVQTEQRMSGVQKKNKKESIGSSKLGNKVFLADGRCEFGCSDVETVVLIRALKREIETLFVENLEEDRSAGASERSKTTAAVQEAVYDLIRLTEDDQEDEED
ncbi:unnamed protein product [Amoebophrya sp. A25]|nr:unnamed protein product [Amoebophrya sp. A25]|eukprot:GSA25T00020813001.1